jgi:hypothetical protein
VKGDIARSQFYMAVRYEGGAGEPDLELVENTVLISSSAAYMGRLSTLIQWHKLDPVDAAERQRNDGVYGYQGNRNPFVDHPDWVQTVFIPRLDITPTATGIRVSWNDTGVTFVLESAPSQSGPWSPVDETPTLDAQGWLVDLPVDQASRVYRLRL